MTTRACIDCGGPVGAPYRVCAPCDEKQRSAEATPVEPCPDCEEQDCGGAPRFKGTTLEERIAMRASDSEHSAPKAHGSEPSPAGEFLVRKFEEAAIPACANSTSCEAEQAGEFRQGSDNATGAECGACGDTTSVDTTVRLRIDGTLRCDDCWANDQRQRPSDDPPVTCTHPPFTVVGVAIDSIDRGGLTDDYVRWCSTCGAFQIDGEWQTPDLPRRERAKDPWEVELEKADADRHRLFAENERLRAIAEKAQAYHVKHGTAMDLLGAALVAAIAAWRTEQ